MVTLFFFFFFFSVAVRVFQSYVSLCDNLYAPQSTLIMVASIRSSMFNEVKSLVSDVVRRFLILKSFRKFASQIRTWVSDDSIDNHDVESGARTRTFTLELMAKSCTFRRRTRQHQRITDAASCHAVQTRTRKKEKRE